MERFTTQRLVELANQYKTQAEFRLEQPRAYHWAQRTGNLNLVNSGLGRLTQTWSSERIKETANQFQTKGEWELKFPGAVAAAKRLGLYDAFTSHMFSPYHAWTDDEILGVARKHATRAEFRRAEPIAYAAAVRHRLLPRLLEVFPGDDHRRRHLVYRIEFKDSIYIGLTQNLKRRRAYHLTRGTVARYLNERQASLPPLEVLHSGLSVDEARVRETEEIGLAKAGRLVVLNEKAGGQTGGYGRRKWTKERVLSVALKFTSRNEFKVAHRAAYSTAQDEGRLDEVCAHMKVLRTAYTLEVLRERALKFSTRGSFQKHDRNAYAACIRAGVLDEVCQHMKPARPRQTGQ